MSSAIPKQHRVLITGASGFIGTSLCKYMSEKGVPIIRTMRHNAETIEEKYPELIHSVCIDDLGPDTDWTNVIQSDVRAVIHLAGRAHILTETAHDPLYEFRRVNSLGTEKLARAAARMGVKRFIFLSSIGVNGNISNTPFSAKDLPKPHNAYAQSKWEAEQCLNKISAETGMEVTIIRPPLVYGPGVKANFRKLIEIVEKGVPLPLASVKNVRSFIGLGNLIHFIMHVLDHPAAANRTYTISDDEDLSTPDLIRKISAKLGRRAVLFPFPEKLTSILCKMLGKNKMYESLVGSLQVDCGAARKELGWRPIHTFDQGLEETIKWYLWYLHSKKSR